MIHSNLMMNCSREPLPILHQQFHSEEKDRAKDSETTLRPEIQTKKCNQL